MSAQALNDEGTFTPVLDAINPDTILRIHGYKKPDEVRAVIRETAQRMLLEGMALFEPVVHYRKIAIQSLDGSRLSLNGDGTMLENPEFQTILAACTDVMVFLLTLGEKPDNRSSKLQQSDNLLEAVFLESASWLAIECTTRLFVNEIRRNAKTNDYRITRRLAPGYGDWPLTDQRSIFRLFASRKINIRLLEGDCMQPKMSRSGMYGIGPEK